MHPCDRHSSKLLLERRCKQQDSALALTSVPTPDDGCRMVLICFRFPQVDVLSHECTWTSAETGQVSVLSGAHIPAPRMFAFLHPERSGPDSSFTRESLSQCMEGGAGQGPRAQSASVQPCLLFVGSWLLSSPSPPPPLHPTFSTFPAQSLAAPYAGNLRLIPPPRWPLGFLQYRFFGLFLLCGLVFMSRGSAGLSEVKGRR